MVKIEGFLFFGYDFGYFVYNLSDFRYVFREARMFLVFVLWVTIRREGVC